VARTAQGDALTAQHQRSQLQLRARMFLAFARLWPIWQEEDETTFSQLVDATYPLMVVGYGLSRTLAASYYQAFRFAEGIPGEARPVLASDIERRKGAGTLFVVGRETNREAIRSGRRPNDAREMALVAMSGQVTEQILEGGRETVIASVAADREARGWARIAGPDCCAFCAMLAGRGPAFKSAGTASFEPHLHCACGVEPAFADYQMPEQSRRYGDLYNQAIREARASGEYDRGTSNDSLNAFRRLLNRQ
jgi:hypothetical protein